jgi:hypothetical protein
MIVPGSAETMTTQLFGAPVTDNSTDKKTNEAAVMLVQETGGSGVFYYIAVARETNGATTGTNAILLGDRIAPDMMQITNGVVTVNYADRMPADPMTTPPSVGISKYFVVAENELYEVPGDIYPLPNTISWNDAYLATTTLPDTTSDAKILVGIAANSSPITNITDLSAASQPFEEYYHAKLTASGWMEDNTFAAGGPGSTIAGYKKGNDYIITGYTSVFKNKGQDSPETCPCDMTFSVFSGTIVIKSRF